MSNIKNLPGLERFLVNFKQGDIIFCEYELGKLCYIIISGEIRLFKVIGDVEKTIAFLNSGDFLGEMSLLLKGAVRTTTAVVLEDCYAYALDSENFSQVISLIPNLRMQLLRLLAKRIHHLERQSEILQLTDIVARVADVLIMLADEVQSHQENENKIHLSTNVNMVASWVGLTEAAVRDALNRYVEQGRIEFFPDHIVVNNLYELRRMVNGKRRSEAMY